MTWKIVCDGCGLSVACPRQQGMKKPDGWITVTANGKINGHRCPKCMEAT